MTESQETLVELLAGKTPVAIYDALHARRCLSARALRHPDKVIEFIRDCLRSSLRLPFTPANQLERLVKALTDSEYLLEEEQSDE